MIEIPDFFKMLLLEQYDKDIVKNIEQGLLKQKLVTLRVNTIKSNIEEVKTIAPNELFEGFFIAKIQKNK